MINDGLGIYIWYYGSIAILTLILGWAIILAGHSARDTDPDSDISDRGWPYNAKMWEYSIQGIIPHLFWTFSVILFAWGAYHVDNETVIPENRILFRAVFVLIMILNLMSILLFYVFHNIIGALVAEIFILVSVIGLIMLISEKHVEDAWFTYVYMLWTVYAIYFTWYALSHNQNNPDVHNELFTL